MSNSDWTPDQPLVSIRDVHKSFGELEVLKGVSLDIKKGEVICIIGPSGSGKSTLIRCINALNTIKPTPNSRPPKKAASQLIATLRAVAYR